MPFIHQLLEFYDAPAAASFTLAPTQAISYFKGKGLRVTFDWRDMLGEEHASAFTIAKMADIDLLADIQASLDDAISNGTTYRAWADSITPLLQQKGWWGRQPVTDPLTGETIVAQLGSPGRLQTIFRTNVQSSYAVGQWEQIQAQKDIAEYLMYDAIDDHRTRPEHAAWDGTILPVEDEWWRSHYPPNGWNCRCGVIQLAGDELADLGLSPSPRAPRGGTKDWTNPRTGKTEKVEKGLDPGWNVNQGEAHLQNLQKLQQEKIKALPPRAATAAARGVKAAEAQAADLAERASITVSHGIDATPEAMARGAGKAQIRAAEKGIADALADNTPYLAKAIKTIQGTKSGAKLDPIQLLAKAKAEAAKAKDNAALAGWKTAKVQGKQGSPAGKAVFDALPEEAQIAIQADIDSKIAAASQKKAIDDELAAISSGQHGPVQAYNLKTIKQQFPDATPAELLEKVKAQPAKLTAGQQASGISGWKKNAIAGKPPTDKQQLAFDSLSQEQQAKVLQQVGDAKAAAIQQPDNMPPGPQLAVTAVPDINPDQFVKIGPQMGTNPGGTYVDKATGTEWYVKTPPSEDIARNEVLAAKLYQAAGVDVPDIRLITIDGQRAIASRMVDGLQKVSGDRLAKAPGAFDGFAADAWLANWDVYGTDRTNMVLRGSQAFRVDVGGAMRYRAQGTLKGSSWGDSVNEVQSLRNPGTAPQASEIFRTITEKDIEASAAKVIAVDDATIDSLVAEYGPTDTVERKALAARLKARKADLEKKYPGAVKQARAEPADAPDTARVTAQEQGEVEASRVNGYTFRTDGDQIEDHNVVVSNITSASGRPITRFFFKVREPGERAISATTSGYSGVSAQEHRVRAVSLARRINQLSRRGAAMNHDILQQWEALRSMLLSLEEKLISDDTLDSAKATEAALKAGSMIREFDSYFSAVKVGKAAKPFRIVGEDDLIDVESVVTGTGPKWKRRGQVEYDLAEFSKSNARLTSRKQKLAATTSHYVIEEDGYKVLYIPSEGNPISTRGVVMIDIDGAGVEATAKGFEIIERIGVKATRSTQAERLELYLDRIAYLRTLNNYRLEEAYAAAGKIAEPAARAAAKLKLINADVGRDITQSRWWNPDGEHQAFGHGRVVLNRPDLDDADVEKFSREHVVYHNTTSLSIGGTPQWERVRSIIEGGGQIGSQVDRMRRGVPAFGSSIESDHRSGGAGFVFTRLLKRSSGKKKAGIYWKPERLMHRTDVFSYGTDQFGNVDRNVQRSDRKTSPDGWRLNARSGRNETNFRDSLSLFDDVEQIIFMTRAEMEEAIGGMRELGYRAWPDGRKLEEVFGFQEE